MPAATEALSESILPNIGRLRRKSHLSLISLPRPEPSEPITIAILPVKSDPA